MIDENGQWEGLTMVSTPEIPKGVTRKTAEWLLPILIDAGVTSGSVTLAEGVTVDALDQARLLGVIPAIEDGVVDVASTFKTSEVGVENDTVALAVTIAVEEGKGSLSEGFTLGGTVKLKACQSLREGLMEVALPANAVKVERINATQATVTVTVDKGSYQFFQVIVE